jgi:hypothetical protein
MDTILEVFLGKGHSLRCDKSADHYDKDSEPYLLAKVLFASQWLVALQNCLEVLEYVLAFTPQLQIVWKQGTFFCCFWHWQGCMLSLMQGLHSPKTVGEHSHTDLPEWHTD